VRSWRDFDRLRSNDLDAFPENTKSLDSNFHQHCGCRSFTTSLANSSLYCGCVDNGHFRCPGALTTASSKTKPRFKKLFLALEAPTRSRPGAGSVRHFRVAWYETVQYRFYQSCSFLANVIGTWSAGAMRSLETEGPCNLVQDGNRVRLRHNRINYSAPRVGPVVPF
jgi:hypothetical protein